MEQTVSKAIDGGVLGVLALVISVLAAVVYLLYKENKALQKQVLDLAESKLAMAESKLAIQESAAAKVAAANDARVNDLKAFADITDKLHDKVHKTADDLSRAGDALEMALNQTRRPS